MELLHSLTTRDGLLAAGFCLIFLGVIARTLARGTQRELDYRKQHSLHHRSLAEANRDTAKQATALEKHIPKIANGIVLLGLIAVIVSFFRD